MLNGDETKAKKILKEIGDHKSNKSHARHLSKDKCRDIGLVIVDMEGDNVLQDLILTAHHAYMHSLASSNTVKIVENQLGTAYVEALPIQQPFALPFRTS